MDRRGACCISNYTGSGAHDLSKFDKIMLRFRPIAPKPVTGNPTSDGALSENREVNTRFGRTKRKYMRDNSYYNSNKKHNKVKNNEGCTRRREASTKEKVVTLPLLPEASVRKNNLPVTADLSIPDGRSVPVWLSFENYDEVKLDPTATANGFSLKMEQAGVTMPPLPPCFAGSLVTVECVTGTWLDGEGLGSTDEERRANLSKDTCPGFISDRLGSVTWTNGSYRKLVSFGNSVVDNVQVTESTRVWLVMKEEIEMAMMSLSSYPAFTCRVKLKYSCGQERNSLTVPCDVWRMNDGGFAWRLDVEAGLSLSLGR